MTPYKLDRKKKVRIEDKGGIFMKTNFPKLFEPGWIGNVQLKNRVIKAPQHTGLANPDGSVTDRMLRYYKDVASGGVSMVIVEYAWIDNDASRASPCQLGIASIDHIPGLSLLAQTIQANGAKAAIQISHAGRQFLGRKSMRLGVPRRMC
jgi:2,4-dienoyl-CoA reductase-like NADH-dependent reductase (Old Yellow Enzyme family)